MKKRIINNEEFWCLIMFTQMNLLLTEKNPLLKKYTISI